MTDHYGVTNDLMTKAGNDITAALKRTLSIAPEHLPVAIAGGAAAIGILAAVLSRMAGDYEADKPDRDNVLLAALLCARCGTDMKDGIARAYRDFEKLKDQP